MSVPGAGLEFAGIGKRFPGVAALDGVSFAVRPGSVHALLGENGAGKSTLLKVLSGALAPDAGQLRIAGQARVFHSTHQALAAGVAVIYQEPHLVGQMSVAENILLGHMPSRFGWLSRGDLFARATQLLDRIGDPIDPDTKVARLSTAQAQRFHPLKKAKE